jgi:hypothetical protein
MASFSYIVTSPYGQWVASAPPIRTATFYYDGCPTDWFESDQLDRWHTIVTIGMANVKEFESAAKDWQPKSWKRATQKYRGNFLRHAPTPLAPKIGVVNALSFQEKTVREFAATLFAEIGIGFAESADLKGRKILKHEYLSWQRGSIDEGYHCIELLENKMLPLVTSCWWIMSLLIAFNAKNSPPSETQTHVTIVSDLLSGDSEAKKSAQVVLHKMLMRDYVDSRGIEILITNSPQSNPAIGDFLADNIAGYLNGLIEGGEKYPDRTREARIAWNQLTSRNGKLGLYPVPELGHG